jgi:hypothetical protein
MDDNLYDEFGNYIGPDLPEVENASIDAEEEQEEPVNKDEENQNVVNIAVILYSFRMKISQLSFMKIRITTSLLMISTL